MNPLTVTVRIDIDDHKKWLVLSLSTTEPPVCLQKRLWFVTSGNSLLEIRQLPISNPSTGFPEALTQERPQESLKICLGSVVDLIEKATNHVPDPVTFVVKSSDGTKYRSDPISLATGQCVESDNMDKRTETVEFTNYPELLKLIAQECQQHSDFIQRLIVAGSFDDEYIRLDVNGTEGSKALAVFFRNRGTANMQPYRYRLISEYGMRGDETGGTIDYTRIMQDCETEQRGKTEPTGIEQPVVHQTIIGSTGNVVGMNTGEISGMNTGSMRGVDEKQFAAEKKSWLKILFWAIIMPVILGFIVLLLGGWLGI